MKKLIVLLLLIVSFHSYSQKYKMDVTRYNPLSASPLSPQKGWVYYGADDEIYKYNGTEWIVVGSANGGEISVTNGVGSTFNTISSLNFSGATITESAGEATISYPGGGNVSISDGVTSINDVVQIVFSGATISGSSSSATVTINSGGGSSTGLQSITENTQTGYRITGADPNNYGDIGTWAMDFSLSNSPSTTVGATGNLSVVFGSGNTASGLFGFSSGSDNVSSGDYSVSIGADNDSAGDFSISLGEGNSSASYAEVSIGLYGTTYSPNSATSFNANDRLFNVGNGPDDLNTSDAFTIYKNGSVVLHPIGKSTITTPIAGMIIIDSEESNKIKMYDGTNWLELSTSID